MEHKILHSELATDTIAGLSSSPKYLSSKYFYDDEGSRIFQDIMNMPEYYLTDCEREIFNSQKAEIAKKIFPGEPHFELIELGAGDGSKTVVLLNYLHRQNINFQYIPIDISTKAIESLRHNINKSVPDLRVSYQIGDYFQLIGKLHGNEPKLVLFLGSNIGNLTEDESIVFLRQLRNVLSRGDKLLLGVDLKKPPDIILKAYNDPYGYTAAFNLNLLNRINSELDADFDMHNFYHEESYDSQTGTATSFLISKKAQKVHIKSTNNTFYFSANEKILMEISQKYDESMIHFLAEHTGFRVEHNFTDSRSWFIDSLWNAV